VDFLGKETAQREKRGRTWGESLTNPNPPKKKKKKKNSKKKGGEGRNGTKEEPPGGKEEEEEGTQKVLLLSRRALHIFFPRVHRSYSVIIEMKLVH